MTAVRCEKGPNFNSHILGMDTLALFPRLRLGIWLWAIVQAVLCL
jgi:uncharacterized membrane protein